MNSTNVSTEKRIGDLLRQASIQTGGGCNDVNLPITGLCDDSRQVRPGCCFIAIPGTKVDGHDYIDQAFSDGAAVAIVEAGRSRQHTRPIIEVANTRDAVARLAACHYGLDQAIAKGRLRLAGVTGTNGKTTVCTMLRSILSAAGFSTAVLGTIANEIPGRSAPSSMTTLPPIELCRHLSEAVAAGATHAVLEVSSHALHQSRCAGLALQTAVFTNLTQDHLDYHTTMDDYAVAKKILFDNLGCHATAVVDADDGWADFMLQNTDAGIIRCGLEYTEPDVTATALAMDASGSRFVMSINGEKAAIETSLIGEHNVRNILCAAAAATSLGVCPQDVARGISSLKCVRGRMERVHADDAQYSVLVDYCHTPDALRNALKALRPLTRGRLICAFGCGGDRDREKRPIMGATVARYADEAVVTSDNPRSENARSIIDDVLAGMSDRSDCHITTEPDRRRAIFAAIDSASEGDTVLIAGKGHETYQMIGSTRLPFDDAYVASTAISHRHEVLL